MVQPSFHNVLFVMTKEATMDDELKTMLRSVDRASKSIIDDVPLLQNVEFSPLLKHPTDWADHTEISNDYV